MRPGAAAQAVLLSAFATALFIPFAHADLELCNRTSFVIESALGIEEKGTAATRGWFRIHPGKCRTVLRGEISADRLFVHARALPLYGAVKALHGQETELCVGEGDFLVAGAHRCSDATQRLAAFAEVQPRETETGFMIHVAEAADYGPEQARLAAVQRLLVLAGYDAEPVDGLPGPRTESALNQFLRERKLPADAADSPIFLDLLLDAAREGAGPGLLWCNETAHTVMAALGVEEAGGIVARGWWRLESGVCLRPELPPRTSKIYSFAEAIDGEGAAIKRGNKALAWDGTTQLCVRNSRFEIAQHRDCAAQGLFAQGFAAINLESMRSTTVRFREP